MEPKIRMYPSGQMIDLINPDPDHIHIEDIAHQLALTNRFNGGTRFPYSVAAHSLYMCNHLVGSESLNRFQALMHDATEAYLGDMVKPLKENLEEYKVIENNLWRVIAKKYNLPIVLAQEVKDADYLAFELENYYLRNEGVSPIDGKHPRIQHREWQYHKESFLIMFRKFSES